MGVFTGGSAVGLLRVLLVASIGVPVCLLGLDAWLSYGAAFDDAARDDARISEVAREHAAKVFNTHELVARGAGDMVRDLDDDAARADEARLHDALVAMIKALPQVGSLVILDSHARLLVATAAYPASHTTDFSDRDYFVALKNAVAPMFLSEVQASRVDGKVFFGLGRRIETRDGHFRGVVDIAILPQFFENFWATLIGGDGPPDRGEIVALLRDDGTILAREPAAGPPRAAMSQPFLTAVKVAPEGGTFFDGSLLDARPAMWRYTFRRVQGYPAYVVAGHSHVAVTAVWARRMAGHLAVGVPVTLALALITWTALQRTRREEAALALMRAEMQRREAAEVALLQSQRIEALGQLTGGVAHDFNNLLTIIMGNFEMIGRLPDAPDGTARLAQAGLAAAQRGAELTAKLLASSRRRMIRPEIVDVNRLLQDFRPVLRQGVTEAIDLVFDLAPGLHATALDPGQLEAAVLNLVANARDAISAGGSIRISTGNVELSHGDLSDLPGLAAGTYVRVLVDDDGPGMPASVASRAFEPFFTTKEVGRGTGLGLSQVYGFCKQAGGMARIRSAPGRGTSVEILLPRALQDVPERAKHCEIRRPAHAAGQTVLVVEDEGAVLDVAVANLRDLGYVTLTAMNAAQALVLLRSDQRIDILFSDVVMPGGMNGVQLSEAARQLRPGLKIVLASGYAGQESERVVPADVAVLAKPFQRDELAAALVSA